MHFQYSGCHAAPGDCRRAQGVSRRTLRARVRRAPTTARLCVGRPPHALGHAAERCASSARLCAQRTTRGRARLVLVRQQQSATAPPRRRTLTRTADMVPALAGSQAATAQAQHSLFCAHSAQQSPVACSGPAPLQSRPRKARQDVHGCAPPASSHPSLQAMRLLQATTCMIIHALAPLSTLASPACTAAGCPRAAPAIC